MSIPTIEVKKIFKTYGNGESSFEAIKGISWCIESGSMTSIVGKSGSGKSTMLHIMATLDEPTTGEVFIEGVNINDMSPKEKCRFRNRKIGFVFQSFYLEESYNVFKNIEMPLIISGISSKERKRRVYEAAREVNMENKLNSKTTNLSGGEKQRVAIARAIVNQPSIIFADEPCGNLDTENGEVIMKLLERLSQKGAAVVLVTHNIEDARKTHRIITLKDGMVVGDERKDIDY